MNKFYKDYECKYDKEQLQQSGIYVIKNIKNSKIYIGSATTIQKRWIQHLYALERDIHYNDVLQRAWNKYGSKNFIFDILEIVDINKNSEQLKNILTNKEQHYIDLYNSVVPNGYNINPKADCSVMSDITKAKIKQTKEDNKNKINDQAYKNILQLLETKGLLNNKIFRISNNIKNIISISGYIFNNKREFNNFKDYLFKNLDYSKPRQIRTIKSRQEKDEMNDLERNCFDCNYYDDVFDYCHYYEIDLPDISIEDCIHFNQEDLSENQLDLLQMYKSSSIDKITENFLNGKIY